MYVYHPKAGQCIIFKILIGEKVAENCYLSIIQTSGTENKQKVKITKFLLKTFTNIGETLKERL